MLFHAYRRPDRVAEVNDGPTLVETTGYVPAVLRIAQLMAAGQRLKGYREEAYDFAAGVVPDDGFVDPTRSPNFDMADAHAAIQAINERYARKVAARRKEEREAAEAAAAAAAAGGGEGGTPPETPPEGSGGP